MCKKHKNDGKHAKREVKWKYNRKSPSKSMSGTASIGNYEPRR